MKLKMTQVALQNAVTDKIQFIRGQKVMLNRDLAWLYGVETRALNQAVRRNKRRFPDDFMFSLSRQEILNLSQFVISSKIKHAPNVFVFTEQGVAMLSGILQSKRAIQVNIAIMRTFAKLREILFAHKELAYKLNELESKLGEHDKEIRTIFNVIHQLMRVPDKPKKSIGFLREKRAKYSAESR